MRANAGGWVLFALALPAVVLGHLFVLLLCLLFIAEWGSLRYQGAGVLTAKTRKRAAKLWGFSTTIGRGILYHPIAYDETAGIDNRTERHEFVHIRQYEDECAWGFFGGLFCALLLLGAGLDAGQFFATWATIWCLSPLAKLPGFLTAVLRYGPKGIYLDAEFERSAYAQTSYISSAAAGKDWETLREERREQQQTLVG
jgi:hypothetical protein